jgi:hypothetical protein
LHQNESKKLFVKIPLYATHSGVYAHAFIVFAPLITQIYLGLIHSAMPPRRARQPAQPAQPQPVGDVVASLADPVGGDLVDQNALGVTRTVDCVIGGPSLPVQHYVLRALQLLTERMDIGFRDMRADLRAIRADMRQGNEDICRRLFNTHATRNDNATRALLPEPPEGFWFPATRADLYDMSRVQVDALLAPYGVDVPAGANLRERRVHFGMSLGVAL